MAVKDTRHKNVFWSVQSNGEISWEGATLAVLMDIRDELQACRRHLARIAKPKTTRKAKR